MEILVAVLNCDCVIFQWIIMLTLFSKTLCISTKHWLIVMFYTKIGNERKIKILRTIVISHQVHW